MNNVSWALLLVCLCICTILPVSAAITTNAATVNATCVLLSGANSGAPESVWFEYGHSTNPSFSSSTPNTTSTGTFTLYRCDEPTFLPGYQYKYRACGKTSGCGGNQTFTMNAIVPHITTNFSVQGEAFILHGGDPGWIAAHIWDVYVLAWGLWFFLLMIAFIVMNIVIKQKSITIAFLLILISGGALWEYTPPQMQEIATILMAVGMGGLIFWVYKRKR